MSRGAYMSILGLYNNDNTVFDTMVFPAGMTTDDHFTVTSNILAECAELEILYPSPVIMKQMINIWSRKELPYWERIYNAAQLEYNAIENYRRTETETIETDDSESRTGSGSDTLSGSDTHQRQGTDASTDGGTETHSGSGTDTSRDGGTETIESESAGTTTPSGSDTTTNTVAGFDSASTYSPHDKSVTEYANVVDTEATGETTTTFGKTNTLTRQDTTQTSFGKTNTTTHSDSLTDTYGRTNTRANTETASKEGTVEREVLAFGNIGVTTSQQMLTQEVEVAKILNVIPIIVDSFKKRFCLEVY